MKYLKPKTFEEALNVTKHTIKRLAKGLQNSSAYVDYDDLFSCGMIGLFQCYEKFEDNETTKFTTFAYFRIKGSMIDEIRKNQIHKRTLMDKLKVINENEDNFYTDENAQNILYLASYNNISTQNIELKDNNSVNHINSLIKKEKDKKLHKAINNLETDEINVLKYRYQDELKLREVGKVLNLSEARIHQIQRTAINKLKYILDEDIAS